MAIRIDILTLFPEMFAGVLDTSILRRAREGGHASYHVSDIRDWADNKHDKVDDRPFGGGPGMVMMCQPLYDAVMSVEAQDDRPATRIMQTTTTAEPATSTATATEAAPTGATAVAELTDAEALACSLENPEDCEACT